MAETSAASLGEMLKGARVAAGQSLDAVAAITRISTPQLEAIEQNQMADLPADVYLRGFVRAYCRAVGLPEAEPLAKLETAMAARRDAASANPHAMSEAGGRPMMSVVPFGPDAAGRVKVLAVVIGVALVAVLVWLLR